jgi:hypothetical protein
MLRVTRLFELVASDTAQLGEDHVPRSGRMFMFEYVA